MEIWQSDYEVNDKEFTKTVLAEKSGHSKYPKVQVLPSKKLTMAKTETSMGNTMGSKRKTQTLTPKKFRQHQSAPEQPEIPTVPVTRI